MFETHDQARLPSSIFIDEKTHRWAYVAQTSNDPWFYITHELLQDGDPDTPYRQQYFIPTPQHLLGLISTDTDIAYVASVLLVTPPWLNESGTWLMEPLARVRHIGGTYCYDLEDGRTYPTAYSVKSKSGKVVWEKQA